MTKPRATWVLWIKDNNELWQEIVKIVPYKPCSAGTWGKFFVACARKDDITTGRKHRILPAGRVPK